MVFDVCFDFTVAGQQGWAPRNPTGSVFLAELREVTGWSSNATGRGTLLLTSLPRPAVGKQGTPPPYKSSHTRGPLCCAATDLRGATGTMRLPLLFALSLDTGCREGGENVDQGGPVAGGAQACTGGVSWLGRQSMGSRTGGVQDAEFESQPCYLRGTWD